MKIISEDVAYEQSVEYSKKMTHLHTHGQSTSLCISREEHQQEGFIAGVEFAEMELQNTAIKFVEWKDSTKYLFIRGYWCLFNNNNTILIEKLTGDELFTKFIEQRKA